MDITAEQRDLQTLCVFRADKKSLDWHLLARTCRPQEALKVVPGGDLPEEFAMSSCDLRTLHYALLARPTEQFAPDDCDLTDRGLSTPAIERIVCSRTTRLAPVGTPSRPKKKPDAHARALLGKLKEARHLGSPVMVKRVSRDIAAMTNLDEKLQAELTAAVMDAARWLDEQVDAAARSPKQEDDRARREAKREENCLVTLGRGRSRTMMRKLMQDASHAGGHLDAQQQEQIEARRERADTGRPSARMQNLAVVPTALAARPKR